MININILKNFVNVIYNYVIDDKNLKFKTVNVKSNSVSINLRKKNLDIIPSNASIQYSYVVDPSDLKKIKVTNTKTVETLISYASLKASRKVADMKYADVDDTINYVITVVNNGNLSADNIIFKDCIPEGVEFISGSVVIDGEPINDTCINPNLGFNIGFLPAKMFKVITFKVKVMDIPLSNEIKNIAQFSYDFSLDENDSIVKIHANDKTEGAITKVSHANLNEIRKEVDKKFAFFGDILTYKTTIPNNGNVDAINVCFHDHIPNKTQLVEGSIEVVVDGVIICTGLGKENDTVIDIKIDNIPYKKEAIVTFKVKIIN